jgi:N-acetyl-anhydromuramyl-L-alanine amidase AmpD
MSGARSAVLALGSVALIGLGAMAWLSRQQRFSAADAPPPRQPAATAVQAPPPPAQDLWRSPLNRRCQPGDIALRQQLLQRLGQLRANQVTVAIHPTNYGERFSRDAFGRALDPKPRLIVLHETVYGIGSAINTFVTPHPRDDDQVSYHALIGQDGTVVQVLDPDKRAFGAGHSAFNGSWVITNPAVSGSVNNFALHVSLETPLDGEDADADHSGYTAAQYDGLAVLLADWMLRYRIPPQNITTHAYVDLGGERADPRSFDWQALERRLQALGLLCDPGRRSLFRSPLS